MKISRPIKGFSLIELMIAIAIVGIIAGLAIPSYNNYILKSGRAEAKGVLLQVAQTLERCYTRYSAYDADACPIDQGYTVMSENDRYELTATTVGANAFELTAVPQAGQAKDTKCGNFTLEHTGNRGISGSGAKKDCW